MKGGNWGHALQHQQPSHNALCLCLQKQDCNTVFKVVQPCHPYFEGAFLDALRASPRRPLLEMRNLEAGA